MEQCSFLTAVQTPCWPGKDRLLTETFFTWQLFFGYQQISSSSCLRVHNCESGKLSQILSLVVKEQAAAMQSGCLQATTTARNGHCPSPPAGNSIVQLTNQLQPFLQIFTIFSPNYKHYLPRCPSWNPPTDISSGSPKPRYPEVCLDLNVSTSDGRKVFSFLNGLTSPAGQKGHAQGSSGWAVGRTPRNR